MENNMMELLDKMKYLSEYDKEVWGSIVTSLSNSQKNMINGLIENTKSQMSYRTAPSTWHIVTAVIRKDEVEQAQKNGLYEIIDTSCFKEVMQFEDLSKMNLDNGMVYYSAGISFLNCGYHSIFEFLDRKYNGKIVTKNTSYDVVYHFEKYSGFNEIEKIVERTAMQYEVDVPIIFDPISRRAIQIILDLKGYDFSKSDDVYVDFQLAQNGLSEILLINNTLIWNVEIAEKNEIPRPRENTDKTVVSKIVPLFSKVYKVYEFAADKNEFYYVDSEIHDIKRFGSSVYLNLHETETIESVRYYKIVIHEKNERYLEKIGNVYEAFYDVNSIHKSRIRTEADIDYVMNLFKNEVAEYIGICRPASSDEVVFIYDSFDSYHYPKSKVFRSESICHLRFKKTDNIYFVDYISYILAFLNYYYPEFYWVGVV